MDSLPPLSADLIKQLDATYPLVKPDISDTLPAIQRKAGQRDVIDYLLRLQNKATAAVPSKKLLGAS